MIKLENVACLWREGSHPMLHLFVVPGDLSRSDGKGFELLAMGNAIKVHKEGILQKRKKIRVVNVNLKERFYCIIVKPGVFPFKDTDLF